jgi:signal transduction histidine kinase/CheY-like chemotaxis protein/HPt (histidine-containing phosphotransfer) domain-containing protein
MSAPAPATTGPDLAARPDGGIAHQTPWAALGGALILICLPVFYYGTRTDQAVAVALLGALLFHAVLAWWLDRRGRRHLAALQSHAAVGLLIVGIVFGALRSPIELIFPFAWLAAAACVAQATTGPRWGWIWTAVCLAGSALIVAQLWDLQAIPLVRAAYIVIATMAPTPVAGGLVAIALRRRRRIEQELRVEIERRRLAEHEARAAVLSREESLARIAHDLRTPITGVLGFTDLLLRGDITADQREQLGIIGSSADLLLALLDDILDYARIESGRLEIRRADFDPRGLLEDSVHLFRPRAREKEIVLRTEVQGELPDTVRGDGVRIRQVLLNLVSNAVKFTRRGEVRVSLTVGAGAGTGLHILRFAVQDDGPGIPEAARTRLFEPFSQINDSAVQRTERGSGLGLAICKHLTELMGGTIGVDSRVGVGSTFWFELRLPEGMALSSTPTGALLPIIAASADQVRLLVVEDDPINRRVLVSQLQSLGLRPEAVDTGTKAIEAYRAGRHDVVLLDCDLPDLDGYEVARRLRALALERGQRTRIAAVTANARTLEGARSREAGIDDVLIKPFRLRQLAAFLRRWLVLGDETEPAGAPAVRPAARADALDASRLAMLVELEQRSGEALVAELIETFGATAPELAGAIRAAAAGDLSAARKAAHRLRGAASNLGAVDVEQIAAEIERRSDDGPLAVPLLDRLDDAVEEAVAALKAWPATEADPPDA